MASIKKYKIIELFSEIQLKIKKKVSQIKAVIEKLYDIIVLYTLIK